MLFRPKLNTTLVVNQTNYEFPPHPTAKNMVYGQDGKRALVYQVKNGQGLYALKVFKQKFQTAEMITISQKLAPYASVRGLEVCQRDVFTPDQHTEVIKQYPELAYAVLMPWIQGSTWFDILSTRKAFSAQDSLHYARSFAELMADFEQRGLAHCDLSGPNIILNFSTRQVKLIDVEEMYGPGLNRPAILPSGSAGYAHYVAKDGLWSADADRFPGSILLVEMLCQCDPRFRQEFVCEDDQQRESFFEREEMQQDGPRYQLISKIVTTNWGKQVQALLDQAWHSPTLDGCPRFSEWVSVLSNYGQPQAEAQKPAAQPHVSTPVRQASGKSSLYGAPKPPEVLRAPQVNLPQTQAAPQAPASSSPSAAVGPVTTWRNLRPAPPAPVAPLSSPQSSVYATTGETPPAAQYRPAETTSTASPLPASKKMQFSAQFMNIIWGFLVVALISGAGILLFSQSVQSIKSSVQGLGFISFYASGSTLMAVLLGSMQAWVFKYRLRQGKRIMFILITGASGLAGGIVTGVITNIIVDSNGLILMNLVAGAIMGGVGGSLSSLGQNHFLGNYSAAAKWFRFSLISWLVIWGAGWELARYIPGAYGTAAAAVFIVLISGAALAALLKKSPEIEF